MKLKWVRGFVLFVDSNLQTDYISDGLRGSIASFASSTVPVNVVAAPPSFRPDSMSTLSPADPVYSRAGPISQEQRDRRQRERNLRQVDTHDICLVLQSIIMFYLFFAAGF